jgi:hypothetical protein
VGRNEIEKVFFYFLPVTAAVYNLHEVYLACECEPSDF